MCSGCHLLHHTAISDDRNVQCGLHHSQFLPRGSSPWMCPTCYQKHAAALYEEKRMSRFARSLPGQDLGAEGTPPNPSHAEAPIAPPVADAALAAPDYVAVPESLRATETIGGAGPSQGEKRKHKRNPHHRKRARAGLHTPSLPEGITVIDPPPLEQRPPVAGEGMAMPVVLDHPPRENTVVGWGDGRVWHPVVNFPWP